MFFVTELNAQDLIVMRSGDEVEAKVINVNKTEINYIKWSNLNGPTYTVAIIDVFMIKYENGEKDLFDNVNVKKEEKNKIETNTSFSQITTNQMAKNNIDFLKREDLFKRARRCNTWAKVLGISVLAGGITVGVIYGSEWSAGAMIGYCIGVAGVAMIPFASLLYKANDLEKEANKINVSSFFKRGYKVNNFYIEHSLDMLSYSNNNYGIGIGLNLIF